MLITHANKSIAAARLGIPLEEIDRAEECYLGFYLVYLQNGTYELMNTATFLAYEAEVGTDLDVLTFTQHVRIPFSVETIEITNDNLSLVSGLIGKEAVVDGARCIVIDRKIVPTTKKPNAYIGYWITRSDSQIHVYSGQMFRKLYIQLIPERVLVFEDKLGWVGSLQM